MGMYGHFGFIKNIKVFFTHTFNLFNIFLRITIKIETDFLEILKSAYPDDF